MKNLFKFMLQNELENKNPSHPRLTFKPMLQNRLENKNLT